MHPPAFPSPRSSIEIPFVKMQGTENHFVFIDAREKSFSPSPEWIRRICDVRVGIGAEELIVLEKPEKRSPADFVMRIYNPDGSEVESCINATRCAALLFFDETGRREASIQTMERILTTRVQESRLIGVEIGKPAWNWDRIPLSEPRDTMDLGIRSGSLRGGAAVNFGNPHVVFFVSDPAKVDLTREALPVCRNPLFTQKTNVEAIRIAEPDVIEMSVLERPGMITQACGSGACAAFSVAKRKGFLKGDAATVKMPAGKVLVEENEKGAIILTGPAEYCFTGHFPSAT